MEESRDSIAITRKILKNCEADFPYGECKGILLTLLSDEFTCWRSCTYTDAQKFANEGIPAVGVSSENIYVIEPEESAVSIEDVVNAPNNAGEFIRQATSMTPEERIDVQFFAYSIKSSTPPVCCPTVSVGQTLANINTQWYIDPIFNPAVAFKQCPWYALGRIGEVHKLYLDFDTSYTTQPPIEPMTRSGGWWLKNAKIQATVVQLVNNKIVFTNTKKNIVKVSNPSAGNIKGHSVACFLFYINGGYYGHVQYIEQVVIENGVAQVYFSDTNAGYSTGRIRKLSYTNFAAQFNNSQAHGNDRIFQGFIQF
jgi:hypothetical protein